MRKLWADIGPDLARELAGITLVTLGLLAYLALLAGGHALLLARLRQALLSGFGWVGWVLPLLVIASGVARIFDQPSPWRRSRGVGLLLGLVAAGGLSAVGPRAGLRAGLVGQALAGGLRAGLGIGGSVIVLGALGLVAFSLLSGRSLRAGLEGLGRAAWPAARGLGQGLRWAGGRLADWVYPPEPEPEPAPAPVSTRRSRRPVAAAAAPVLPVGGTVPAP
ncbi:MAG: DNA translocase FtsK 4TM domain-containing protein, partial [Firmicutes bacterium]|nr:DNA translocase FtsK 4TM domain-containing protein [Bacillota bacterium]